MNPQTNSLMKKYSELQISWWVIIPLLALILLIVYSYIHQIGSRPIGITLTCFLVGLMIAQITIFYSLKTTVYADRLEIVYGFGIIKRAFTFDDISTITKRELPWYYGVGIKHYNGGTLYSASFTSAIEFTIPSTNRKISIGSKNPTRLAKELADALCEYETKTA